MNPAYAKILEYAAFGAIGALAAAMSKSRGLALPRIVVHRERDGQVSKWIDMGFLAAPVLGAVLAVYFDTTPANAIAWGCAAGWGGTSILTAIQDALLRAAGLKVGGLPETASPAPSNGASS
ncbi:MAG: hypothetical protein ACO1SX_23140 [Actinomycetota bacterium]